MTNLLISSLMDALHFTSSLALKATQDKAQTLSAPASGPHQGASSSDATETEEGLWPTSSPFGLNRIPQSLRKTVCTTASLFARKACLKREIANYNSIISQNDERIRYIQSLMALVAEELSVLEAAEQLAGGDPDQTANSARGRSLRQELVNYELLVADRQKSTDYARKLLDLAKQEDDSVFLLPSS